MLPCVLHTNGLYTVVLPGMSQHRHWSTYIDFSMESLVQARPIQKSMVYTYEETKYKWSTHGEKRERNYGMQQGRWHIWRQQKGYMEGGRKRGCTRSCKRSQQIGHAPWAFPRTNSTLSTLPSNPPLRLLLPWMHWGDFQAGACRILLSTWPGKEAVDSFHEKCEHVIKIPFASSCASRLMHRIQVTWHWVHIITIIHWT
jgi:hypothetical protein